ncbi:MAG TPA: hypothetical protein VFD48_15275 [Pyrinomonadaceae bacterium]|nr:hypothetical protein [Pyrinomonadaceae bacterium]
MTFEEIQDSLPNGLHDAGINSITVDYLERKAIFHLEIWTADLEDEDPETYRLATLSFMPFLYCVVEPPDPRYPFATEGPSRIDAGSYRSEDTELGQLRASLPDGAFACWFFINSWNSFIHVAALNAEIVVHESQLKA